MRIIPVTFMAILVLSMTTISASMMHPHEPLPQAFAQSTEDSIRDLGNYVVFGLDEVEIEKEVTIITGSVGTQNEKSEVEIDEKVTFEDPNSAVVGDKVEIDKKAVVQDVYYNKLKNKGEILGTENTPLVIPVIDRFPNLPDLMPGEESIKVEEGQTLSLSEGQYDEIKVKKDGTLIFEGGTYSVSSIKSEKETRILFDDVTDLIVHDKITIGEKSFFGPSEDSGISASEILIFVVGEEKMSNEDDYMDYGDENDAEDGKDFTDIKKTKVEFKKESTVFANVFAPNGEIKIKKESHVTGAFVAKKIDVEKNSILELDSQLKILTLIDEYSSLIEDLENLSDISDEEIADLLKSKIATLRQIISQLESHGFTADILAQRMSPTTSTIVFFNELTMQSFEIELSNEALAALLTIGILEETLPVEEFTGTEITLMLSAFTDIMGDLANIPDEALSIEFFQLVSCVSIVDSTGDCFVGGLLIGEIGSRILHEIASHPDIVQIISEIFAEKGAPELFKRIIPQASISGFKFNDLNNSGTREPDEPLLPNWNFVITSKLIGGVDSGIQTKGQTDSNGFYFFNDLDYLAITETIVIIEDLEQSLIDQGWVHTTPSIIEIPFEPDLVRTDVNFGNRQEAILEVTKVVNNDNGGTLGPGDFVIHVTGTTADPADFSGSSVPVEVVLTPGEYIIFEDSTSGYTASFSENCTGNIVGGERKTCTITNDDEPQGSGLDIFAAVGALGISVLFGDGAGGFGAPNLFETAAEGGNSISAAAGDFDNDGNQDIAVLTGPLTTCCEGTGVSVYFSDGSASFSVPQHLESPFHVIHNAIETGDFNNDGFDDILTKIRKTSPGFPNNIHVYLSDGVGGFVTNVIQDSNDIDSRPAKTAVADFNDDGNLDLINTFGGGVRVHLGDGAGNFPTVIFTSIDRPQIFEIVVPFSVATFDFNNDGKVDAVTDIDVTTIIGGITSRSKEVAILSGDGTGNFNQQRRILQSGVPGNSPGIVATGDFNGDGNDDIVLTRTQGDQVRVITGDGRGNFNTLGFFNTGDNPIDVTAADLNGDGIDDIITLNTLSGDVSVFISNENGFSAGMRFALVEDETRPQSVGVANFNP